MSIDMVRAAALAAVLYGARRYWRNWGTTKDECTTALPGDELLHAPVVTTTEGVRIDRAVEDVWPWVAQIGQDRGGVHSDDTVRNLCGEEHHSADDRQPERPQLAPGDTVRLTPPGRLGLRDGIALTVAKVIPNEAIILRGGPPAIAWDVVWSIHLVPRWDESCRLLMRSRVGLRHPAQVAAVGLAGPVQSALTRRMLLGIKHRAERHSCHAAAAGSAVP